MSKRTQTQLAALISAADRLGNYDEMVALEKELAELQSTTL